MKTRAIQSCRQIKEFLRKVDPRKELDIKKSSLHSEKMIQIRPITWKDVVFSKLGLNKNANRKSKIVSISMSSKIV